MTHKYYYVSAGKVCDATTAIYTIFIGQSAQGCRDLDFLQQYANEHGHYFNSVSEVSDIFIKNLKESLAEFDIKHEHTSARDLVRLFKDGTKKPLNNRVLKAHDYQMKMLDTSYRIISNLNRRDAVQVK